MTDHTSSPHHPHPSIDGSWRLDPSGSSLEFCTRSLWGLAAVRGHFESFGGWLDLAGSPEIDLTVAAASVQTGNRRRDKHLRSADFLDSTQHPQIRFVSEWVEWDGHDEALQVGGRLSACGRSVPLQAAAHVHPTDGALQLDAELSVPHRELGMTWNFLGAIEPLTALQLKARLVPESSGNPSADASGERGA